LAVLRTRIRLARSDRAGQRGERDLPGRQHTAEFVEGVSPVEARVDELVDRLHPLFVHVMKLTYGASRAACAWATSLGRSTSRSCPSGWRSDGSPAVEQREDREHASRPSTTNALPPDLPAGAAAAAALVAGISLKASLGASSTAGRGDRQAVAEIRRILVRPGARTRARPRCRAAPAAPRRSRGDRARRRSARRAHLAPTFWSGGSRASYDLAGDFADAVLEHRAHVCLVCLRHTHRGDGTEHRNSARRERPRRHRGGRSDRRRSPAQARLRLPQRLSAPPLGRGLHGQVDRGDQRAASTSGIERRSASRSPSPRCHTDTRVKRQTVPSAIACS